MIEQKAFVLHSRPYRDNQQLVNLLTENDGKVAALVYVGQSKKSIKKGSLQPFLPLTVRLKGQRGLKNLVQVDSYAKSYPLRKNHLYSGFYLNELLIRLLTEDIACQPLFLQYHETIAYLAQGVEIAPQLRNFELILLDELGLSFDFSPVFEHQVNSFYYIAEQGFVPIHSVTLASEKGSICYDRHHLQIIAKLVTEQKPITIPIIEKTFKLLMRQVLNNLLGNKPLNSRKLFITN